MVQLGMEFVEKELFIIPFVKYFMLSNNLDLQSQRNCMPKERFGFCFCFFKIQQEGLFT